MRSVFRKILENQNKAVPLLILGSLVCVFLAGGPKEGGGGFFLFVSGLSMVLWASNRKTPWFIWALGLMTVATSALSLLPAEMFGSVIWREALFKVPGTVLPRTLTVDPSVTIFWVFTLLASILIFLYIISRDFRGIALERLAVFAVAGCFFYTLIAWIAWVTGWNYPFVYKDPAYPAVFGFFPNRNHTAGFLVTGSILSLGLLHRGFSLGKWLLALLGSLSLAMLSASLLLFSHSRAGLLFLVVGAIIWILGLGKHRDAWTVAGLVFVALYFAAMFLNSESPLLKRLKGDHPISMGAKGPKQENILEDARWGITRDTIQMIRDVPWTGSGMGNYPSVYPHYAKSSLRYKTYALHAESDWLTLAAEAGLPTLLLAMLSLLALVVGIPGLARTYTDDWPLKWAFLAAFFAEILHGFVDVPLHRVELGWWILVVGGIGFSGIYQNQPRGSVIQNLVFRITGVGIALTGILMIWAQWGWGWHLPPYESWIAQDKVLEAYANVDAEHAEPVYAECETLIQRHPMNADLIHQYGLFLVQDKRNLNKAKSLFAVERALLPNDSGSRWIQGWILSDVDQEEASTVWKDGIRVQSLMDKALPNDIPRTSELFHSMLKVAGEHPSMNPYMASVSKESPETMLIWLQSTRSTPEEIEATASDSTLMARWMPKDRGKVLELFRSRGNKVKFQELLKVYPEDARETMPSRAMLLASEGKEQEACKLLITAYSIPTRDIKTPGSKITASGQDVPSDPLDAANYYMEHGNMVAARRLLGEAHPQNADEIANLSITRANLAMAEGRWSDALSAFMTYLEAKGER